MSGRFDRERMEERAVDLLDRRLKGGRPWFKWTVNEVVREVLDGALLGRGKSIVLTQGEARLAVRALIDAGDRNPYSKELADRLLKRRIDALYGRSRERWLA